MKEVIKDKKFWASLITLVLPITIQNFFASAVTSADVFMLGFVGQDELSAVSLANQFQFLLFGFMFGINSGIVIMSAQYWGKKDSNAIQAIMGIALKYTFAVTSLIAIGCIFFPKYLMTIYTADSNLIEIGCDYLKIVGFSYILMGISQVYHSILKSLERAVVSTIIATISLSINIILNALFIFGLLGFPKLGVIGVAYATLISRIVEAVLCIYDLMRGKVFKFNPALVFKKNKLLSSDFIKYSLPALINDGAWTLAFSFYSVIMGHLNNDVVAANSVSVTVRELFTVVGFALCGGASVMLGVRIGENRLERAKEESKVFCIIAVITGVITGIIILLIRPLILKYYILSDRASEYLSFMMIINSYYVIGQILNTIMIAGIFRAGGKTKWGMVCDIITMWLVSVPLGIISAFVLKLPPMTVYFILCLDEFWKIPAAIKYFKSYKWLDNITRTEY